VPCPAGTAIPAFQALGLHTAIVRQSKDPWTLFSSHLVAGQERMEAVMGRSGMVFSILAIAAGAVMYWAVTSHGTGFRVSTVGVILMVVGGIGLVTSAVVFGVSRRPAASHGHTYDREAIDAQGRSATVHEEVHQ
jgi:hypothetical protein